jgi:hypothetical protein
MDRQKIAARLHACCVRAMSAYAEADALVNILGETEPPETTLSIRNVKWHSVGLDRDNMLYQMSVSHGRSRAEVECAIKYLLETIRIEARKTEE